MKISVLGNQRDRVVQENHSLRGYLTRLESGSKGTPRSWLYEDLPPDVVLNRWLKKLKILETGSDIEKLIYEFDTKQLSKFGQQGIVPAVDVAITVESFAEQYVLTNVAVSPKRPLTDILGLRPHSLGYRSLPAVIDDMRKRGTLNTNSGWRDFARRDSVIDKVIADAKTGRAWLYPAIILFRHYNGKLRVVWMYPMAMNLLEYQATQPLQALIQKNTKYVTPWLGFEHVKERFTELWAKHPYAFGGDTTAMDAHMQKPQNTAVAESFANLFSDPTLATNSLLHVNDIDIVIGTDAVIANQEHGVASGSGWTQLCETIFQILKFDEFIQSNNLNLTIDDGMGIGDDYVWFFDQKPDSEKIVKFWEDDGLPGKPEKQSNEDDSCTFLQRLFIKGYYSRENSSILGGIYPTIRALNSLVWPERQINPKYWNSDMFCIRTYMILENVVDHPLFHEFVEYVVKGQKDLIPFAKQSSSTLNQLQKKARLVNGLTATYNQEKLTSKLSDFASIRYAASL